MNYSESSNLIHGSVYGIHVKQEHHHDMVINERLQQRLFTSKYIQPNLGFSSSSTRQTMFPVLENRQKIDEPMRDYEGYAVQTSINSMTANAPPATYLANIDIETSLQNRVFALQSSPNSVYVPNSTSDLYNVHVEQGQWPSQPHGLLFETRRELRTRENAISRKIGTELFSNHTRTQLRAL
jgi:hypothetical protein